MSVTKEEIDKVASLSALQLSESELKIHQKNFGSLLEYIAQLKDVSTDGVEPFCSTSAVELGTTLRADQVSQDSFGPEEVLKNAPEREDGSFRIPKVL